MKDYYLYSVHTKKTDVAVPFIGYLPNNLKFNREIAILQGSLFLISLDPQRYLDDLESGILQSHDHIAGTNIGYDEHLGIKVNGDKIELNHYDDNKVLTILHTIPVSDFINLLKMLIKEQKLYQQAVQNNTDWHGIKLKNGISDMYYYPYDGTIGKISDLPKYQL